MSSEPPIPPPVHRSVLLDEVVHWLAPAEGSVIVDGTAGAGGHSAALADRVGESGLVIALDRDPEMLELAARAVEGKPVTLVRTGYAHIGTVLDDLEIDQVDGILLDLGLSSDQLAWEHRGFSFAVDGPLDMRFDPRGKTTAADLVNDLDADELADIIFQYGEERHSRKIARRIIEARRVEPITTTARLAEVVRRGVPGKWGAIDPATRTFQALRIAVNGELDQLDDLLAMLPDLLKPGGRAAIISFHSLEDRRVKHAFRDNAELDVLTRKPVMASEEELAINPRARSAKLRVAQRCPDKNGSPNPQTSGAKNAP
ncbi:16S rRNA (cytosine(1402)-N(4))-methyltransferase RsmH [Tundrisphaera sp. TA3]|uniref:16S rRNA (cytosine(1402)-N(4))-methyltransferase RsmH n=1 Tax=Tundrisphaera sp. TA3 TaxID=3435775 RepID=UPI003EBE3290